MGAARPTRRRPQLQGPKGPKGLPSPCPGSDDDNCNRSSFLKHMEITTADVLVIT
jgi:hypothetical protein